MPHKEKLNLNSHQSLASLAHSCRAPQYKYIPAVFDETVKKVVGDMSIAVLMATFPHTPSLSSLGPSHVPAQAAVALASGPEPKGVGGEPGHSGGSYSVMSSERFVQ